MQGYETEMSWMVHVWQTSWIKKNYIMQDNVNRQNISISFPFLITFELIGFGNPFFKAAPAFVCLMPSVLSVENIIRDDKRQ